MASAASEAETRLRSRELALAAQNKAKHCKDAREWHNAPLVRGTLSGSNDAVGGVGASAASRSARLCRASKPDDSVVEAETRENGGNRPTAWTPSLRMGIREEDGNAREWRDITTAVNAVATP